MPAQLETLPQPMRFAKKMATLTSEGDEVAGDPPSPRLGVSLSFRADETCVRIVVA